MKNRLITSAYFIVTGILTFAGAAINIVYLLYANKNESV